MQHEGKAANAIYDDMPNLRAAFDRAIARDLKLAADLAAPRFLFNYWHRGAETGNWYERIMARPGADELEQTPILFAAAAGHAFHGDGDRAKAAAFIERGLQAEATPGCKRAWDGFPIFSVRWRSGRETRRRVAPILRQRSNRRAAPKPPCELMSLCMIANVRARTGDREGAEGLVREVSEVGKDYLPPTLMGYIHYARGGIAVDPNIAIDEYQTTAEWAKMAANHLGVQRVKQLIAGLKAANAPPEEALDIHIAL